MYETAIRVENLCKMYQIGQLHKRNDTLRDAVMARLRHPRRAPESPAAGVGDRSSFWALKDISFSVNQGEIVGIIGRNGAGKSTLLKILARITEPSRGQAEIFGRVGSLLEVGTGFHPELSGRENVYFSGAMLGMRREEIDRKFDEIVAFSGVEKFLDTPMKRYSSGMNVRLGFAVAAHLEPEILLVDEVLAVGDVAFQKKCLGKMSDVVSGGRTILFVSHNMAAIANLCDRTLLLEHGEITKLDETGVVIDTYLQSLQSVNNQELRNAPRRAGGRTFKFTNLRTQDLDGEAVNQPRSGQDVIFELSYESKEVLDGRSVVISIGFYSFLGQPLFLCRSDLTGIDFQKLPAHGVVHCRIPKLPLPPGEFQINLHSMIDGIVVDWVENARSISVIEGDFYGTGRLPEHSRGDLLIEHTWSAPDEASPNHSQKSRNA